MRGKNTVRKQEDNPTSRQEMEEFFRFSEQKRLLDRDGDLRECVRNCTREYLERERGCRNEKKTTAKMKDSRALRTSEMLVFILLCVSILYEK